MTRIVLGLAFLCSCSPAQDSQPRSVPDSKPQSRPVLLTFDPPPKGKAPTVAELEAAMKKLVPLHKKLGKPQPGDWLERHKERGQTFSQYLRFNPVLPRGKRKTIYIQPLGEMSKAHEKIVQLSAEYMALYFGTTVKVNRPLPLAVIPKKARRHHHGRQQILSTYVLDDVLKPRLPRDAACFLAFTAVDLWPGRGWNFVFGQASLRERVGVWSIARNGDPTKDDAAFRLCLLRTLKTATHETGHMFSLQHCIAYECNQCGSNSRAESDRRPLALCPECMAKVCWGSKLAPTNRYRALAGFLKEPGLAPEREFFLRSLRLLER